MATGENWGWQVQLLGGLEAQCGNVVIRHFRTRKAGVLFAYLALHPERLHPRETLLDLLWPDADVNASRASLRTALTSLRHQLEPPGIPTGTIFLRQGNHALGVHRESITTDVALFEAHVRSAAHATDPAHRERLLQEALTLYQGELLPGYYDDWILSERERLAALYEQACALRDTGVSHQEKNGSGNGERAEKATVAPQPAPVRLPLPLNRFFGREAEMEQITSLLAPSSPRHLVDEPVRLLTLTGPGGAGKTRLAVEVARRLVADFENRVFFIPLEGILDADLLALAILERMETQSAASDIPTLERLVETLSRIPPFLLLLDNFEHLMETGAPLVATLLLRVPTLTCLVTSRQRLLLDAEREVPLTPLPIPNAKQATPDLLMGVASIALFVDRAQNARPDFQITQRNAPVMAHLSTKLEGIPLSIELCAAWAQTLTPTQMLSRLDRRLDLLIGNRRELPPRHRSLRAVIEGSYRLLPLPLRRFFIHLSVFRGGGTVEAVEQVCEEPQALHYLTQLRDHSLIETQEAGDEMRFGMLETLRAFAHEQLPLEDQILLAQRHAAYFVALAEEMEPQLRGAEQAIAIVRLEADHDNLRAVFGRGESYPELVLRLAGALGRFWLVRGYWTEGRNWTQRALTFGDEPCLPTHHAKALLSAATMAWLVDAYEDAMSLATESLNRYRETNDRAGTALALTLLGRVTLLRGDVESAVVLLEESVAAFRQLADAWNLAYALDVLAFAARDAGDYDRAAQLHEEGLALHRVLDDHQGIGASLSNLGDVAQLQGDWKRAAVLHGESLMRFRAIGDKSGTAYALCRIAMADLRQGHIEQADALHRESLQLSWELRDKRRLAESLERIAAVQTAREDYETAASLLAASDAVRAGIGAVRTPFEQADFESSVARTRSALDDTDFVRAWTHGRAMTLEEAVLGTLAPDTPG